MTWLEVLKHNGWQALILIDQLFGLIVSTAYKEKGWGDLTLSANAYRWEKNAVRSRPRRLIDKIFFWQKEHCRGSYIYEQERRHLPPEMR